MTRKVAGPVADSSILTTVELGMAASEEDMVAALLQVGRDKAARSGGTRPVPLANADFLVAAAGRAPGRARRALPPAAAGRRRARGRRGQGDLLPDVLRDRRGHPAHRRARLRGRHGAGGAGAGPRLARGRQGLPLLRVQRRLLPRQAEGLRDRGPRPARSTSSAVSRRPAIRTASWSRR
ncbi:hypothetical protein [Brachybacterium sp. GPGPB12]|uniref:hypothetical protein n=1 Tax=Brachybacterium sp. GPGPB12 TaxID=3023517 RepID=UPI0031342B8B